MTTIPIHSPVAPFLGIIPGGLTKGCKLRIRCEIQGFSNRCQINLQNGAAISPDSARSDISLHISIRPSENAIIRNHLKNQVWGQEERSHYLIQPNQSFEVMIEVDYSFYKIYMNGAFLGNFHFRLPLTDAKYISVSGTVIIAYILIDRDHGTGHHPTPGYPHPVKPPVHHPIYPPVRHVPPVHHIPPSHHIPAPPPMRPPPPPYPGFYPGHHHPGQATPYGAFQDELKHKMSHFRHHEK